MKTASSVPKIGVLICTCGGQIAEKIDTGFLTQKARELAGIAVVFTTDRLCSAQGMAQAKEACRGCDRLLFAGCSERSSLTFNEDRIAAWLKEMGLDRAMFEVANIREQCVWIHDGNLTAKALDMLRMAHAKLLTNLPVPPPVKLAPKGLVIGGGPAGMQAAYDLALAGTRVVLVEKKAYLGGHFCQIPYLAQSESWPAMCVSDCVAPVQGRKVVFHPNITLLTASEVEEIIPENGNFRVRIKKGAVFVDPERCVACGKCAAVCPVEVDNSYEYGLKKRKAIDKEYRLAIPDTYTLLPDACTGCGECLKVCPTGAINLKAAPEIIEDTFGAVILATGFKSYDLSALTHLNYGSPNVLSSMEMERLIAARLSRAGSPPERIVFMLCGASRIKNKEIQVGVPYCSRNCCSFAVKQANRVLAMRPDVEVTMIYFGDIRTYGRAFEQFYNEAQDSVEFVNGEVVRVTESEAGLKIELVSPNGETQELEADLLVLAEALLPEGNELIDKLKVKTDKYSYPLEIQPRLLRPTESYIDRVYVAGAVVGPKLVQESVEQGSAAALKALGYLARGEKELPKFISEVNAAACSRCRICEAVCPHGAIKVTDSGAAVDPAFCQGCGLCASVCPSRVIGLRNFTAEQILRQVEVAFAGVPDGEPKILGLLCYWCSYASADLMGIYGHKIPHQNFRSIRIRCSSSVSAGLLLEIYRRGVDGIIIAGCPPKNCHHGAGNYMTAKRVALLSAVMRQMGFEGRLKWEYIGVPMWRELAKAIAEMDKSLRKLGPVSLGGAL
ncbi:hydrogenase iron-sulfur subunit [Thermodesulfitimonas autotrophica]|uniref:hydrogenase iron-sulfur subunit n=1 Tax=Thermodesulfitimonas autotrophica TaxID=1894989 RepID=UPI002FE1B747